MRLYGVDSSLLGSLVDALAMEPKVRTVLLFGSRARGNFSSGSDIDLAVSAPGLSYAEYLAVRGALEDLPIVFKTDLVHLEALPPQPPLAVQIARDGIVLYRAEARAA